MAFAPPSTNLEKLMKDAFATNNLQCIYRAVDAGIFQTSTIIDVAQAAEVDRTTLYRAFRLENGPSLNTMRRVLRALEFQLVVEPLKEMEAQSNPASARDKSVRAMSRQFTIAFNSGDSKPLFRVFSQALRAQENVSQFATRTIVSRESLYRAFTGPKTPKFRTVLSFLNALELRFSVQRLPRRARPGA